MPFKTRYFKTKQEAIKYFTIMSKMHLAFLALDKEYNQYFVANEQDYNFFAGEWGLEMELYCHS